MSLFSCAWLQHAVVCECGLITKVAIVLNAHLSHLLIVTGIVLTRIMSISIDYRFLPCLRAGMLACAEAGVVHVLHGARQPETVVVPKLA
jgi:hypothetical protein